MKKKISLYYSKGFGLYLTKNTVLTFGKTNKRKLYSKLSYIAFCRTTWFFG